MPYTFEDNFVFDIHKMVLYDHADSPQYDDIEDSALANLIQASLQRCATDRPTFDHLASQPFFAELLISIETAHAFRRNRS